ncbi:MAG: TIGR00296 family protein [Candidatus Micrarchaeota archaeon]|nr:TIGR00296 family protein [Candidatus Micrarchaeota archaeon]
MPQLSLEEGTYLVRLARRAIESYFESGRKILPDRSGGVLSEPRGVFVTLETYPSRELRGCIGYPLPIKELALSVVDCALSSAFEDPRFPPLEKRELSQCVVEVSVLSVPQEIKVKSPDEYPAKIKVGRDGLIIDYGYSSGLLLPQVPVEWNWNEEEFLSHLCQKAGLPPNMWRSPSARIRSFQAQIFCEEKPAGKVSQKRLIR